MLSQMSFSLFAQSAQQQSECPPAGASQEVNEAVPSLAAPSASGQQAGTPLVFDGVFRPIRGVPGDLLVGGWDARGWAMDWQTLSGAIDAPEWLPTGSHTAFVAGRFVKADGYGALRS